MKFVIYFDSILERISRWGLVSSLSLFLGLSVVSIVLRWMGQSPMWIEPLVRHLVFLSAFLGGSLATSKGVHIKVDVFTKFIEKSNSSLLKWSHKNLITLFCLLATAALTKASWDFYIVELEFGAPSFLNIHSSILVGIIPLGMGLISLRFFTQLIIGVFHGVQIEPNRLR